MVVIATGLHNDVAGDLSADVLPVCPWHPFGSMC